MTTLEEARRCPKCQQPGPMRGEEDRVRVYCCANERCRNFGQGWLVQVDRRGNLVQRGPDEKDYPKLTERQEQMGRDYIRQAIQEDPSLAQHFPELS